MWIKNQINVFFFSRPSSIESEITRCDFKNKTKLWDWRGRDFEWIKICAFTRETKNHGDQDDNDDDDDRRPSLSRLSTGTITWWGNSRACCYNVQSKKELENVCEEMDRERDRKRGREDRARGDLCALRRSSTWFFFLKIHCNKTYFLHDPYVIPWRGKCAEVCRPKTWCLVPKNSAASKQLKQLIKKRLILFLTVNVGDKNNQPRVRFAIVSGKFLNSRRDPKADCRQYFRNHFYNYSRKIDYRKFEKSRKIVLTGILVRGKFAESPSKLIWQTRWASFHYDHRLNCIWRKSTGYPACAQVQCGIFFLPLVKQFSPPLVLSLSLSLNLTRFVTCGGNEWFTVHDTLSFFLSYCLDSIFLPSFLLLLLQLQTFYYIGKNFDSLHRDSVKLDFINAPWLMTSEISSPSKRAQLYQYIPYNNIVKVSFRPSLSIYKTLVGFMIYK